MQTEKSRMPKKKFRIGELAKELKLKKFVIRFWEREFGLQSDRSRGGQRFYTEEDFATFSLIKDLLYAQGFTIAGARHQLKAYKEQGLSGNVAPATTTHDDFTQAVTPVMNQEPAAQAPAPCNHNDFYGLVKLLKDKLSELQKKLTR